MILVRYIILLSFFLSNVEATNITTLLNQLEEKKSLYHKTKVESAGLLILYKRSDLERMQAYKLKDILKSLRFFTYKEGYIGSTSLSATGRDSTVSSMFRLYIDNLEVSSAIYGSSMLQFGEIDLGFVDHIEIYEGGNALSFGNEPGLVTIRLYSKNPKKEKDTTLQFFTDNRGSLEARATLSHILENETSLFVYVSSEKNQREHIYKNQSDYSKDSMQSALYMKYAFDAKGSSVSVGNFNKNKDAFVGVGMRATPLQPNEVKNSHTFLNLHLNLPYTFTLDASVDKIYHRLLFSDKNKIRIVQNPQPFSYFDGSFNETIAKTALSQKIVHLRDKGIFKWGVQGIHKEYSIKHMLMDGINFSRRSGPSKMNVFSVFAEESLNINKDNLLITTLKLDTYRDDFKIKNDMEKLARVGYIHLFSDFLSSKIFYAQAYLYPGFAYTSTFPNTFFANPSLGAEHCNILNAEFQYKERGTTLKIGGYYAKVKDAIVVDHTTKKPVNITQSQEEVEMFAKVVYLFNTQNCISAELYKRHLLAGMTVKKSPVMGGYIRSLNTINRFDIFNELIYRSSYTYPYPETLGGPLKIATGFDYSAGVKWRYNHALTFALKGENLLDKASKVPIYSVGATNAIEKRILGSVEYLF